MLIEKIVDAQPELRLIKTRVVSQRKVEEEVGDVERIDRNDLVQRAAVRSATIVYGTELFQQSADFLASKGRDEEAIAVYQEALQILESLAAETTQDSGLRNLIARYEAAVADIFGRFDSETKTIKATSQAALLKARSKYQESLDALRNLQERGVFYSDLANRLEEVSRKLSACGTALAKLKS